jgi:hypothetical protein
MMRTIPLIIILLVGCTAVEPPQGPLECSSDGDCWDMPRQNCSGYPICDSNRCIWHCPDNPCEESFRSWGLCEMITMGVEYDPESSSCTQRTGSGCASYSPFLTIEECDAACSRSGEGIVKYCKSDDECSWIIDNCCPPNAGAHYSCANPTITSIDCDDERLCPQFMSPPPPDADCLCVNGTCRRAD